MPAVLDKFKQAQQDILARMRELEPMVAEYEELKSIAERLDLSPEKAAPATRQTRQRRQTRQTRQPRRATRQRAAAAAPAESQTRTRRAGRSRRSGPGNRREDILRLVSQNPGVTINQLGKELKVDPTGLYRPVRALVAEGAIDKQGASLHPKAQ